MASEEFQSGLLGLRCQRVPFPIEPETAEQYIRSFDRDLYTDHRFSGASDLAVWELVALHHWFDPSRMNLHSGCEAELMFLQRMSAAWDAAENRLPAFFDTLGRVLVVLDMYAGVLPLSSRDSDEHWMWRMSTVDFIELMLEFKLPGAPEPSAAKPGEQIHIDISQLPPLIRLAVYVGAEVSRPAALGGSYVLGDRHTVPNRRECVDRHATRLKLKPREYSKAVKEAIIKMAWPSDLSRGGKRSSRPK